jgi:N-acetylglucosamine kinase-like BadF-type ATPase
MTQYFLGIDGGQSGTTAIVGNRDGKVVGWASGGPCNHVSAGESRAKFLHVMRELLTQAASRAGIRSHDSRWSFESACLGMSGGPDDKKAALGELVDAHHLLVTHDAMIALEGATSGEPGVVVIAGTGSIAFGRNARGETSRAGGWGYIFGDEGSAFDIVRQALRAVLREYEGWGGKTALTPALLEATHSADANELLHLFYRPDWSRDRIAALAPLVDEIAGDGDPTAANILQRAAHDLALSAASVRRQLWQEDEPTRVSWTGGVFNSAMLLERFRSIVAIDGNNDCAAPDHGPAIGALLLAYRTAGVRTKLSSLPASE